MNLKFICTQVEQIVVKTGKFIEQQQKKISLNRIEKKGINDFVTDVDKEAEKLYKSVDIYITEINEFIQLGYIVTYHDNYLIHEKVVTGMRRENNKLLIYLDGNEHCKGKIIYTKNPRVYYCTENWFEESFKVQIPFKVARKTFLIRKGEGNE